METAVGDSMVAMKFFLQNIIQHIFMRKIYNS